MPLRYKPLLPQKRGILSDRQVMCEIYLL